MSSFRFQARYGLFTYSQCGRLRPQQVSEHFTSLGADHIIGRETHQDGGTHLHVFADFRRKYRTRDNRKFDVEGFHPNIVPSLRNPAGGWDYATKDGDICAGELSRPDDERGSRSRAADAGWDALRAAETRDDFFRIASEHLFSHLVKSFNSFSAYADWKFRVDRTPYIHDPNVTFDLGQLHQLREWIRGNLPPGNKRGISLLLWGRSRTGKTWLARSFGSHCYFGGLFALDEYEYNDKVDYAVFDDIQGGFKYFPAYKSWLGQQAEFYCTDKFRKKKYIKWGRPCIWIMNEDPYTQEVDIDWLEKNCLIVHIDRPLYQTA
ncbi:replication associated protein [Chicken genomovirus mg2_274u]|nr:replication associated protein [Chicken genomovirus mg2_274u]WPS96448.1 MAG: replication protein [Genomoviridae sp.]